MSRAPVAAYPAISRGPRGSFEWAMDQLRAGNEVRREHWPIEVRCFPQTGGAGAPEFATVTAIWHLYRYTEITICQGFNSGVVGADNDSWGNLGMDSAVWIGTIDDELALDWQLVSEVGPEQIAWLDAHRMQRHPNEAVAVYNARQRRPDYTLPILSVIAAAIIWGLCWAASKGLIPW